MMPVVWLGERSRERRADVIRPDDEAGLLLLVGHLAGMGHVRIAYVGGLGGNAGPDREKMYRSAMEAHGLARHIDVIRVGFDEYDGADAANSLLLRDTLPSAVVACSDQCAQGVLAVFRNAGVDVPGEVSVTGYDDTPVASLPYNELTTVGQDVGATAEATLVAIQQRIVDPGAAPTELATEARLIVRRTTGPARQGNPRRSGKDRIRPEAS
jgi:DNA-binding LacI/PurR family transcriptional regulator